MTDLNFNLRLLNQMQASGVNYNQAKKMVEDGGASAGNTVVKVIVVPSKLVNIVVK